MARAKLTSLPLASKPNAAPREAEKLVIINVRVSEQTRDDLKRFAIDNKTSVQTLVGDAVAKILGQS